MEVFMDTKFILNNMMVQNWFENRSKPETDPAIWHGPAVGGSHLWRTFGSLRHERRKEQLTHIWANSQSPSSGKWAA